ncbi:unnamed protein product [Arctia plantaginis]|uniref:NADH dehydrogenase [ubiquinone] 1 alpha subcomplex subunit 6 n=1 Tax=Arctia plantaginis TaxID=874455 RepID=A0A8S1BFN2_ARCPL|nr:unnamed protein product [Arctia plantaginis]CAB3261461.1 unnamed protein product [Arctia plantaginis]
MSSRSVRPMMSSDLCEARRRALGLYRAIYRYIPYVIKYYDIPKNIDQCRWMLRSYFYKHAYITDVRVIDMLIIKGYIELKELTHQWQSKHHVIRHWNPSIEPKCTSFIAKFIEGN